MKFGLGLVLAVTFLCCDAVDREGTVIKIVDGDTFDVIENKTPVRIRMFGIDAPERGQPFNKKAKEFTESIIAGKKVRIEVHNKDQYGRTVADVYLMDGTYVNAEIVRAGYAWQFKRYSTDAGMAKLEEEARQNSRGLWQDEAAIPPWEFRKRMASH